MICKECAEDKEQTDYYVSNRSVCKACLIKRTIAYCEKHPEQKIKKREKRREKQREYYREWYKKNGRKRDKTKQAAHTLVALAIARGELIRPEQCSKCDRTVMIEGHHEDYLKPLTVVWLCNRCHRSIHTGMVKQPQST